MHAERKPVDVLAVMKVDAIAAEEWRFKQAGDAFAFAACKTSNEARAAVAELIEAANAAADVLAETYAKYQTKIGPFASQSQKANGKLRAALARCGVQS